MKIQILFVKIVPLGEGGGGGITQHPSGAEVTFTGLKQMDKTYTFYHVQKVFVALAINVIP